jgi:hypothetical protein
VAAGVADCAQMSGHDTALSEACAFWQSSQENSSLLRGAARVLTGMPHYFSASYIANYEQKACGDPASRSRAHVLLEAVRTSLSREPSDWADEPQPPGIGFASRGLKCKPEDEQILEVLRSGEIVMPLWGVTLSRGVATGYGTRFTFVIEGAFQGVAAWRESGIKAEELEVIAGGRYEVDPKGLPDRLGPGTEVQVRIRQVGQVASIYGPEDNARVVTT